MDMNSKLAKENIGYLLDNTKYFAEPVLKGCHGPRQANISKLPDFPETQSVAHRPHSYLRVKLLWGLSRR